jgi:hypothetical protein
MATTALPTLSGVRAFTGGYLISAAVHWSDTAGRWIDAYDGMARDVVSPAGTEWRGEAAEAVALRVGADRSRVGSAADELTAAAASARRAVDDLQAAKANLLSTVRAAEAAGFEIGEDFSLTSVESATAAELAAREAQMRSFGFSIRSDVLALVKADEDAAAQIARAANGLRSLDFGGDDRDAAIQAVDFHGAPLPEKPAYSPPIPPPEGWSTDPLMRAAQKIAYGHAWDKHGPEFPGMNQAGFAQLIYNKMQQALTDPSGLRLGLTEDGAPVIYDPADNVIVIRDTRTNTTQAGTAYKPQSTNPNYIAEKLPIEVRIFTAEDLADGPPLPSLSPSEPRQGGVEVPRHIFEGGVGETPSHGTLRGWGTHVSPDTTAKTDGALGILGRILLGQTPPDPHNPANWS